MICVGVGLVGLLWRELGWIRFAGDDASGLELRLLVPVGWLVAVEAVGRVRVYVYPCCTVEDLVIVCAVSMFLP